MKVSFQVLLITGLLWMSCTRMDSADRSDKQLATDLSEVDTVEYEENRYGFVSDTLTRDNRSVQPNESFYSIFSKLGYSPQQIYGITRKAHSLLDSYQLKPGQEYKVFSTGDSISKISHFVWEPNSREFIVFDFSDSLRIYRDKKKMITRKKVASGKIETSLYETMQRNDLPPILAYKLSRIYAWEIDFFSLRPGDRFKVYYEKNFINNNFAGIGRVLAAEFTHRGNTYHAYYYYNGKEMGYYNREGKSLQKALLKAPLKYRYISSGYSRSRYHPILHRRTPHRGIDYVAPRGTPVVSVGNGTVITARYKGANGNMVKIRHNGTYTTTYIHLSRFADGVYRGAEVKQGEVVGYVGSTGRSTGSHLDYRLYVNGRPVNPRTIELPPSKGIENKYLKAFHHARKELKQKLDSASKPPKPYKERKVTNTVEPVGGKSS